MKANILPSISNNQDFSDYDHSFVGKRMKELRKKLGESRESLAAKLKVSATQYGQLEVKSSISVRNFVAIINYFVITHNVNPNWILIRENSTIPMFISGEKDLVTLIDEVNLKLKDRGLMVSMVPKV